MVDPRRPRQPVLAGDLRIEVKRGTGLAPWLKRDIGPARAHCLPPEVLAANATGEPPAALRAEKTPRGLPAGSGFVLRWIPAFAGSTQAALEPDSRVR